VQVDDAYNDKHLEACNNGYRYFLPSNLTHNSYIQGLLYYLYKLTYNIQLYSNYPFC